MEGHVECAWKEKWGAGSPVPEDRGGRSWSGGPRVPARKGAHPDAMSLKAKEGPLVGTEGQRFTHSPTRLWVER